MNSSSDDVSSTSSTSSTEAAASQAASAAIPAGVSEELLREASTTQRSHVISLVGLVVSIVLYVVIASQSWAPVWVSILLMLVMGVFGLWYMFLNMRVFILKSERKRATKAKTATNLPVDSSQAS